LLWALFLVVAMTFVTFVIFFQIPADPARFLVPNQNPSEHQLEVAHEKLGVDDPFFVQYGRFLWRLAHLDLGYSFAFRTAGKPTLVTTKVFRAVPVTVSLLLGGAVLWLAIAIPLGTLSAVYPGSLLDRAGLVFVLIGVSAHPVIIGLFFRQFLGYQLGLAPIEGYCPMVGKGSCGPAGWAHHMLLPWLTFSLLFAALYARMVRANVIQELHEHYVRTARAKGASELRVLRRHVLRNALLPVLAMLGMDFGLAFAGAVFVERVFALNGLGSLSIGATAGLVGFDLPVILGVVLVVSVAVVVFNLIVDLLLAAVDPRVRVV
jgi:peptide/nickel transport system permease protein